MSSIIKYNNYIFNIAPLINLSKTSKRTDSLQSDYEIVTLRLSSTLIPSGGFTDWSLTDMYSQISGLQSAFSKDNQLFIVSGEGREIIKLDPSGSPPRAARVISLDIPTAKWIDKTPFDLTLEYYDKNYDNIIEKVNNWSWALREDDTYLTTNTLEAVGLNTLSSGTNAFENARDWVIANSGNTFDSSGIIVPSSYEIYNAQIEENANIINGRYSLTRSWIKASGSYTITKTISLSLDKDYESNIIEKIDTQWRIEGLGFSRNEKIANAASYIPSEYSSFVPGPGERKLQETGGEVCIYSISQETFTKASPPYSIEDSITKDYNSDANGFITTTITIARICRGFGRTIQERTESVLGAIPPIGWKEATQAGETSSHLYGGETQSWSYSKQEVSPSSKLYCIIKKGESSIDKNGILIANGSITAQGFGITSEEKWNNCQGKINKANAIDIAKESSNYIEGWQGILGEISCSKIADEWGGSITWTVVLSNDKAISDKIAAGSWGCTKKPHRKAYAIIPTLVGTVAQDLNYYTPSEYHFHANITAKVGYTSDDALEFANNKINELIQEYGAGQAIVIESTYDKDDGTRSVSWTEVRFGTITLQKI